VANVFVRAAEMTRMKIISRKLLSGVGFS